LLLPRPKVLLAMEEVLPDLSMIFLELQIQQPDSWETLCQRLVEKNFVRSTLSWNNDGVADSLLYKVPRISSAIPPRTFSTYKPAI